jgi:hypothetical protein
MLKRILPSGLLSALQSTEAVPKDKDLINVRDNLSLAMDSSNDKRGKIIPQQIMNNQSVRVIEKQINNLFQHWKQRVSNTKVDVIEISLKTKIFKG